jgi:hypothetical protein
VCSAEALLRIDTQLREQDVPAVAQELGVVHRSDPLRQKRPDEPGVCRSVPAIRYCGFACADTALPDVVTGCPLS